MFKDANKDICTKRVNGKIMFPLGVHRLIMRLIFNMVDRTWLLRKDVSVEAFLTTDDDIYFTSSTTPGQIWKWRENSGKRLTKFEGYRLGMT